MSTITAKDLTKDFPRSPLAELEGFPWLPRLIDKVRALKAGTLGEYTPFPCGGDRNFLATVGLEPDAIKAVIDGGASDAEIAAWVKANAKTPENVATYRAHQLAPLSGEMAEYLKGSLAELAKERPELDLSKIDNFTGMICLEEGHPYPAA